MEINQPSTNLSINTRTVAVADPAFVDFVQRSGVSFHNHSEDEKKLLYKDFIRTQALGPASPPIPITLSPMKKPSSEPKATPNKGTSENSIPEEDREFKQIIINFFCSLSNPVNINNHPIQNQSLSALDLYETIIREDFKLSTEELCRYLQIPRPLNSALLDPTFKNEVECVRQHFALLSRKNEGSLQNLFSYRKLLHYFYFSDASKQHSVFMLHSKDSTEASDSGKTIIQKSGMPDGINKFGPILLEIQGKGWKKLQGLQQGVKRVLASANTYGIFRRHICIVKESTLSFIVVFDMNLENSTSFVNIPISIYQCSEDQFPTIFVHLIKHISNHASYMYHPYSMGLLEVCRKLETDWWNHQIALVSGLSAKVFKLIKGSEDGAIKSDAYRDGIIIKINDDCGRFNSEISALKKISCLTADYPALAYLPMGDSSPELMNLKVSSKNLIYFTPASQDFLSTFSSRTFLSVSPLDGNQQHAVTLDDLTLQFTEVSSVQSKKPKAKITELTTNDLPPFEERSLIPLKEDETINSWIETNFPQYRRRDKEEPEPFRLVPDPNLWYNTGTLISPPLLQETFQGLLISRRGREVNETLDRRFYVDVIESLKIVHAAQVVHRDIRSCNVLYFPYLGRYLLNDFDLSACLEQPNDEVKTCLNPNSERAKKAPLRIRSQLAELKQRDPHLSHYELPWTKLDDILMFTEYCNSKGVKI